MNDVEDREAGSGRRMPARPSRWRRELAMAAACLIATLALTWPLARVFATRLCGGYGDPQLTLWSMRWMHDALASFQNPFFTDRLYHPLGTTLVFHTFDLPSALLVVPLWGWVPAIAIYNTAAFLAFALTAYGMARLARELTGDDLIGLLAGLLFAGVPYHYVHLQGHLHLTSMGWVPLYAVHLVRIADDRASGRDAALGGLFLALASLASWYHLVFATVISAPLLLNGTWYRSSRGSAGRFLRRGLVLVGVWALLAGPLLAAMVVTRQREHILGAHDSLAFSADAASFLDASMASLGTGEHATFAGFTVTALALLGALRERRARVYALIAMLGALLMLGPMLIWQGGSLEWRMPYGWLERIVPAFDFIGVPVRFGYVMYFGLVGAAAFGLAVIARALPATAGRVVMVAIVGVALWEYRPGDVATTELPVPPPMLAWAADDGAWAVLDTSGGWRQMWHATLHRKPIVGGYVGRVPSRVEDWIPRQAVLAAIAMPDGFLVTSRVESEGLWTQPLHDAGLVGDRFSAEWAGKLVVPAAGLYTFAVSGTADAALEIANAPVAHALASPGEDPTRRAGTGSVRLAAGPRPFRLRVLDAGLDATVDLRWKPPGGEVGPIPVDAFRTDSGGPGLDAHYDEHLPPLSRLGLAAGREALRRLSIRYVVTTTDGNRCVEEELRLPEVYRGEGVRIFEVPASDAG